MNGYFLAVIVVAAAASETALGATRVTTDRRVVLSDGWLLQSSAVVSDPGADLSRAGYKPRRWFPVSVPSTVLSALIKNQVYPDLRVGLNAYRIPDSSDEFNAKHDLAKFSHLPEQRNPWRDPWWFRKEFDLPKLSPGHRVWLHFDAINYRAAVWVNGRRVADRNTMAGMFQRFQFDITHHIRPGVNALAVEVFPVDHPGTPDTMWEPLGKCRDYVGKEIMRDVTEVLSIGYDCMMTVPDRNMGLWQPVWIDWTGPVDIRDPFVVTDLPLPETNQATLAISAELVNATAAPVKGVLRGCIAGTDVQFRQPLELAANETRLVRVEPAPVMRNPRLWWPLNYGEQRLYELTLTLETDGGREISDEQCVPFGVREVGYEMHEINGWHGRRVLVNGRRIFCRGGYIQPELIFDWDARRMETELRYYAGANLNLIYFEDIPNPPAPFLELCDRYGILFGHCAYSCYWLRPDTPYPDDFALLERCTVDMIKRYRNHPSLLFYMAMNEEDTKEEVYEMWRRHVFALDGTRWFIPSAYFPSDRKNVGAWFKKDLPTGMTDKGASYSWAEPEQYFRWVREARNWMFMMEGGSASLPPMSSLSKFLPEATSPTKKQGRLYPLDRDWAHHGANDYFKGYDQALRRLHGEPESVVEYCWKGHLVTADQHRSIFEAVNHRVWDITSGMTQWKINACEPTVQWQLFDWYMKPMVSWFYAKKACEPLHVQLNLVDRTVAVINLQSAPQPDLHVRARVFDLNAGLLWEKSMKTNAPADAYRDCFAIPEPDGATQVYFVKLELRNREGRLVSDNFYWLRAKGVDDLKSLQTLPPVTLKSSLRIERHGDEQMARVHIANPRGSIAFFVQVALTQGAGGAEILPVLWDDNYFSLLPGETREIAARFPAAASSGARPVLEVGGWNVESDFTCTGLRISPETVKAGQRFTVTAACSNTFLDGSRVWLKVDGKPAADQWVWHRQGETSAVEFSTTITQPGVHELAVGAKKLRLDVHP
jgi:hypothetical protein